MVEVPTTPWLMLYISPVAMVAQKKAKYPQWLGSSSVAVVEEPVIEKYNGWQKKVQYPQCLDSSLVAMVEEPVSQKYNGCSKKGTVPPMVG